MGKYGNLKGYDMVLAVDQETINNRLDIVFGERNRTDDIKKFLDWELPFYKITKSGKKKKTGTLTCKFEAPFIDFNTNVDNGCRLNMKVKEGTYSRIGIGFDDDGEPTIINENTPIKDVVFSITADMSTKDEPTFSDDKFTVQALILRLEEVTPDNVTVNFDKNITFKDIHNIEVGLQTIVANEIKAQATRHLAEKGTPLLLLGKVKVPKVRKTQGPLAPLAAKYSVFKELDKNRNYIGGSLNYLLLVDNDENPHNPPPKLPTSPIAGRFGENLVIKGKPGTLLISDETVIRTFIIPSLNSSWGTKTSQYSFSNASGKCIASLYNFNYDGGKFESITLKVQGSKVRGDYVYKKSKDYWTGDIHATATGFFEITFTLDGEKIKSSTYAPDPDIDTDTDIVGRIFGNIITLGFNEIGVKVESDNLKGDVRNLENALGASVGKALECIELPGDAIFRYESVEIGNASRVKLGLRYEEYNKNLGH